MFAGHTSCKGHMNTLEAEEQAKKQTAPHRTSADWEECRRLNDELASSRFAWHQLASLQRRVGGVAVTFSLLSCVCPVGGQTQCNADCSCSAFGQFTGECTSPTPACGFLPCTGGASCPTGPPQSLSAFVTGPGTLALNWTDPVVLTMVDQYNIYYTMAQGENACVGKTTGATCTFVPPPGSTRVAGVCGPNAAGTQFCWLDFSRYILAIPPCNRVSADDTSCNFQEVNTGIVIGATYQYKIDAGRCCYGDPSILGTAGCRACTDFDAFQTCPKSATYAFSSVTGQGFPKAVQHNSIRVDGDRALRIDWLLPSDTGTLAQVPEHIFAYVVTRSTAADFSADLVTFDLAGNAMTLLDSGLTPNVNYYYRVQSKNAACGRLSACGGTSATNLTAVGVPTPPTGLTLTYLVGRPNVIRGDWALPVDTGLGDGSLNHDQLLWQYTLYINGVYHEQVGSVLNTTFIATGLTSGTLYTFAVTATNIAGEGTPTSASKIASGLPNAVPAFTAVVNPTEGPLKIRLNWNTPSNTGQGNQVEPITGYKILMGSSTALDGFATLAAATIPYEQTWATTAGCAITTAITFTASRKDPYFFRIFARNFIGYSLAYKSASEQSIALPSAPRNMNAVVTRERAINLTFTVPADKRVGDTSRELFDYKVFRSWGKSDMSCTVQCSACLSDCFTSEIGACCVEYVVDDNNKLNLAWQSEHACTKRNPHLPASNGNECRGQRRFIEYR